MRLIEFTLNEGGNVFKNKDKQPLTQRINKADVEPTLKWLEQIIKLDLRGNMLGTTGKRDTSGDLDIAVDEKVTSKEDIVSTLTAWCKQHGLTPKEWIRKSGTNVHFKTPIKGNEANGFVQTDLMFGDPQWMSWSMRGAMGASPFKGMHRHIMMASVASAQGMKWSYQKGLIDRKTDEVLSKQPDQIAQLLLGQNYNADALESVETILDSIRNRPDYEELVQAAAKTFAYDGLEIPQ